MEPVGWLQNSMRGMLVVDAGWLICGCVCRFSTSFNALGTIAFAYGGHNVVRGEIVPIFLIDHELFRMLYHQAPD